MFSTSTEKKTMGENGSELVISWMTISQLTSANGQRGDVAKLGKITILEEEAEEPEGTRMQRPL